MRRKIEDEHALFASIINSSDDAIISKTLNGIITSWNGGAEKVFGYTSSEMIGNRISILIPSHLENEENEIMDIIRSGKVVDHYETERIGKDGKLIYVSLIISPIKNAKGTIIGASKISRNITLRKETEAKLREGERQFRNTLDNLLEGIQIHDFNWKYTYVNHTLAKYSKCTREELLGLTLIEKFPGIEDTHFFEVIQRCMIERKAEQLESEFIFPDGSKADFELSIQPVPEGIFILSIDITERKKAQKEILELNKNLEKKIIVRTAELANSNKVLENKIQLLIESEEKLKKSNELFFSLFEQNPAALAISRLNDGVIININKSFLRQFEFANKEDVIGKTGTELNIWYDKDQRNEMLRQLQGSKIAVNLTGQVRTLSGVIRWVSTSVLVTEVDSETCLLSVTLDITDQKRTEEQLEAVNKELEAFSYSVSHDLRAPLRAISGYTKILEEDYGVQIDEDGRKILKTILLNSKKMGNLIDDLLAFSKLGRKQVTVSEINMMSLVDAVKEELFFEDSEIKTEFKLNALPAAKGDRSLIKQVWTNLISNAVKYSKYKVTPHVEIGAYEKDQQIVYYIKDNGAGFDMQYYNKLFGVFQRLHSSAEFEGTGIGLAIVQKIVQRHNGTVWAEAKPGEGACFYFSLPLVPKNSANDNL
ncbi:MAG: PAS domain S-box protein [Bacteroidia bacterium]|nr:PAS domain S-box protein [Bacteroidia bacterium]